MDHFELFNDFPEDIRRFIFEIAFEDSDRKAKHLALVSREVNSWIEPLLYWRVKLDTLFSTQPLTSFIRTFRTGSKNEDFYASHVKVVLVNDFVFEGFAAEFLPLCKNVRTLSCRESRLEGMDIMRSILQPETFPRLRKLGFMLEEDAPPEFLDIFHHPLAQNLTHLDLSLPFAIEWDGLSKLQHLRYFSFQPAMSLWISSDYHRGARQLKILFQDIIPHLPPQLEGFITWVTENMIRTAAYTEAADVVPSDQPTPFAEIARGLLDPRIVLAAHHKKHFQWSPDITRLYIDAIQDFLSQTIVLVDPNFNKRLVWDDAGTDVFWAELHRILRRRRGAFIRNRPSHWHRGNEAPRDQGPIHDAVLAGLEGGFHPFKSFPENIRRLVFEIAYKDSNNTAKHLALVSKEIHSWIEPLIFRDVVLSASSYPERVRLIADAFSTGKKEARSQATYIQSLYLDEVAVRDLGIEFFRLCSNVVSLTVSWPNWSSIPGLDGAFDILSSPGAFPRLRKLSLQDFTGLPGDNFFFTCPTFRCLTHLDLQIKDPMPLKGLETLLSLKHLRINSLKQIRAIPGYGAPEKTGEIIRMSLRDVALCFPPNLETFVFLVDTQFIDHVAHIDSVQAIQGLQPLFADITHGKIDPRIVLGCQGVPRIGWVERKLSQRDIDGIYEVLNQVVPCPDMHLPWDDPFGAQRKDCFWLDLAKDIVRKRFFSGT